MMVRPCSTDDGDEGIMRDEKNCIYLMKIANYLFFDKIDVFFTVDQREKLYTLLYISNLL